MTFQQFLSRLDSFFLAARNADISLAISPGHIICCLYDPIAKLRKLGYTDREAMFV